MGSKIVTPQKECKYLETCNFKEGMMSHCNSFNQRTDRCMIFKLMNEVQELIDFKREIENKKTFQELTGQNPLESF